MNSTSPVTIPEVFTKASFVSTLQSFSVHTSVAATRTSTRSDKSTKPSWYHRYFSPVFSFPDFLLDFFLHLFPVFFPGRFSRLFCSTSFTADHSKAHLCADSTLTFGTVLFIAENVIACSLTSPSYLTTRQC